MAVYQISKIQVRRGKKGAGTGLPVLSSGEFAWAIDSQELYIGNGSLAEGSPKIGNTQVITENDNIFQIFKYIYRENVKDQYSSNIVQTGPANDSPIKQAVSDVLDRYVWAESFGVTAEPTVINNTMFQRAINELYLKKHFSDDNTSAVDYGLLQKDYRVELHFTPGLYRFDQTIYLPSYVSIVGAGIDRTIFQYEGTGAAFVFVNENTRNYVDDYSAQLSGFDDTTVLTDPNGVEPAKYANLQNFTLVVTNNNVDAFKLNAVRDSNFENLQIIGPWTKNSTSVSHAFNLVGSDTAAEITCKRNTFNNITIRGMRKGFYAIHSIYQNSITNCKFDGSHTSVSGSLQAVETGVEFGDGTYSTLKGPRNNSITNCIFTKVDQHCIHVISGTSNKARGNTYTKCGEDTMGKPVFSNVRFDQPGNSASHETFDRYEKLSGNTNFVYLPEVEGNVYHQNLVTKQLVLNENHTGLLVRLPLAVSDSLNIATSYKIEYVYKSQSQMRKGVLDIAVDVDNEQYQLSDEYECTNEEWYDDTVVPSQMVQVNEMLTFNADISNNGELLINYSNNSGEQGRITFTYSVLTHS